MASKGATYERSLCVSLSQWWTQDLPEPRTDIFWRTAGRGARATIRHRKNKKTAGSYGDITALDPIGKQFLDAITIEAKRGYSRHTIHDLLDKSDQAAPQMYEQWFAQAEMSHKAAGSYSWMVIHKRDRRDAIVWMPQYLWASLHFGFAASMDCRGVMMQIDGTSVCGTTLEFWLNHVTPEKIKCLSPSA